jgi:gliding motility-associated-like protein
MTVSYYTTQADADASLNAITTTTAYESMLTTIYVRVETTEGCYETTSFELVFSDKPVLGTASDLLGCDSDNDGSSLFNLTFVESEVLGGLTDMTVSYYASQSDADNSINELVDTTEYESVPTTIYVRVENSEGCYETTSFELALGGNSPIVSIDTSTPYEFCPTSSTPITIIANADNFTLSDEVTISWWHDGEELEGENGLELSNVLEAGTYTIVATSNFSSECMSEDTVEVVEVACIIPQGISPNNDNKNDSFDLSDFDVQSLEIYNRYGRLVYSKTDYTNEWSGQSKDGDELPVGTYYYVMKYQGNKVKAAWVYINREQ